jgi:RimJ/RimL family protein N-acetyltransferase
VIRGKHSVLRFSEPDDACFYRDLYLEGAPRAALLDVRREYGLPTLQDIQELLKKSEASRAFLFTIEDTDGHLAGWCGLRALNIEAQYCELFMVFASDADYSGPVANETLSVLLGRAFNQLGLRKVMATCLDCEMPLHACLLRHGFVSCGIQRDILYGSGAWRSLDTLAITGEAFNANNYGLVQGENIS